MYKEFFNNFLEKHEEKSKVICIDGVVGVGKSTFSEILSKELNIELYQEPVLNNPLLDKFYHDKKRYSFPLQIFFLNKRFQMIQEALAKGNCLMDRSIYGDIIFSKMLYLDGDMTKEEFNVYQELLETMLKLVKRPNLMIYLKSSVDKAIEKIERRGRDYELEVPKEYWESLNFHYEAYMREYNLSNIITFNMDSLNPLQNIDDRNFMIKEIKKYLGDFNDIK